MDDGPKTLEGSLALAREAIDNGVTTIMATPHLNGAYINDKEKILAEVERFQVELDQLDIQLTILPGQEVHVYGNLIEDLKRNQLLTCNSQEKYMLLELPHDHVPKFIDQMIFEIQLLGIIPIIPHPERNLAIREHPILLYQMVKRGALVQLTAASIIGILGKQVQKFTRQCMQHNLCHLVASDAHRVGTRGVSLKEAYDHISGDFSPSYVDQLQENARKVTIGDDIYVDPPKKIEKKSFFNFLKRSVTY
jgi:protein-tyrosine phosphatase